MSFFATLTVTVLVTMVSCTRTNTTPSPAAQITGKWFMKEAISASASYGSPTTRDSTSFSGNNYFDFKTDSTLDIWADSTAYTGKWSIVGTKLMISGTGYIDNSAGWELPVLNNTTLQLYYKNVVSNGNVQTELWLNLTR